MAPWTPISFSANAVIEDAFLDLGVFAPGEAIPDADAQLAWRTLNKVVGSLALQSLTSPFADREVFSVVAGQNTYTIGPGGNFNTVKPAAMTGAGLLMPSAAATTGQIEVPITVLTNDQYAGIAAKDLQNPMFTGLRYDATYAGGLGQIYLYPTPNVTTYQLVIYHDAQIAGFANLTTTYDFPPGYAEVLQYQLEKRLAKPYGVAWTADREDLARNALFLAKRNNYQFNDLVLDSPLVGGRGYDINSDTGG